mgnify:FL=1
MSRMTDVVVCVGVGLFIGLALHYAYVKPHSEARNAIVNCMVENGIVLDQHVVDQTDVDRAREIYELCVALTNPGKK